MIIEVQCMLLAVFTVPLIHNACFPCSFGSLVRSEKTGIIFNDLMADFSIPGRTGAFEATEVNYIQPGKRPLSSMTPSILINEDKNVEMVVGASGGARITTSVAQVCMYELALLCCHQAQFH